MQVPAGPGVRDDGGVDQGGDVPIFYDPLISKLIVWGENRDQAIRRMRRALLEHEVLGVRTTAPFFAWLLREPRFNAGLFHTGYLDEVLQERQGRPFGEAPVSIEEVAAMAAALDLPERRHGAVTIGAHSHIRQGAPAQAAGGVDLSQAGGWKRRARLDALRH
jgi:acetyl/propionyl-CoA carboxylase alpha subunit